MNGGTLLLVTDREHLAPDGALDLLVSAINSSRERVADGPGVVLTLGGLVVSGKIIPNWQWFEDVRNQVRDAFVFAGGDPDAEHGFAFLFGEIGRRAAERAREAAEAQKATEDLAPRYQRAVAKRDVTAFIHLHEARVYAPDSAALPGNGMFWRGRLSEIAGWAFGLLGEVE